MASGTTCVQRLDGSRDSAIHTKYHILQCSSSMRDERYPLLSVIFVYTRSTGPPDASRGRDARGSLSIQVFLGAFRTGVRWSPAVRAGACAPGKGRGARAECQSTPPAWTPLLLNTFAGLFYCASFENDPSAGSPTETLLRLLLPLNNKVQWTSRGVVGSEPPTSPRSEHFTGSFNRQIAPPTKNGHAPPPIESRKSSQSVNPYYVWSWYAAQETDFEQAYIALAPRLRWQPVRGGSRGDEGTPRLMHGRRPRRPPVLAVDWARPHTAVPGECPESSIQYSPLARSHHLVQSPAPAAPSWTTPPITDMSI
ncbi:hypothetical protein CQW23_32482 [Capsicum baccatum]|uniref:Uncharacterized protein n=1 Tax=Capsicum baccatum TaxID=33114 RepID=A0A2G2V4I9_CAPBA|nr:hypothetical protein CQW23_32482 [Capsicum baccatum]